jgi:beta-glucosidase
MEIELKTITEASEKREVQVEELISKLNDTEKLLLLGGQPTCGATFGCEAIGLPPIRMSDGPMGVHWWCSEAVAYPALVCAAAAWDRRIWSNLGQALGRDCRARGVHILLAPGVNLYRSPLCGRNFEYCGEDPLLASQVAVEFIRGVQSHNVSCTVKHFAVNFQEYDRHNVSSDVDERTLHEVYLPAFKAAVIEAKCGAVMMAYNLLNGTHCSENDHLISDILKGLWKFDGLVMSDWASTYNPVAAANAGLDLEMPTAQKLCADNLIPAMQNGQISKAVIDDKIRRLLRLALRFGWLAPNSVPVSINEVNSRNQRVALEVARAGIVLLKNDRDVLPLVAERLKKVAVIGPNAHPAVYSGGGSAHTTPTKTCSTLEALRARLRGKAEVAFADPIGRDPTRWAFDACGFECEEGCGLRGEYFQNDSLQGEPVQVRLDSRIDFKWGPSSPLTGDADSRFSVRWTGTLRVEKGGSYGVYCKTFDNACRVWVDGRLLLDSWNDEQHGVLKNVLEFAEDRPYSVKIEWSKRRYWSGMQFGLALENPEIPTIEDCVELARDADVAVICVGFNEETEGEGFDRPWGLDQRQENLIRAVAAVQPNAIVVVNAGGGIDMRGWLHAVAGLVYAFYPGQEGGQVVAEILLGEWNPSGRLPFTIERNPEDRSSFASYHTDAGTKRVELTDKLEVGYRHFDKHEIEPLFPFGFGLGYTKFSLGNLALSASEMRVTDSIEVRVDIANVGSRIGNEVIQVYVSDPVCRLPRPLKELKAFEKVELRPYERKTVTISLDRKALEFFDPALREFVVEPGKFVVQVGNNACSTTLCAEFSVIE